MMVAKGEELTETEEEESTEPITEGIKGMAVVKLPMTSVVGLKGHKAMKMVGKA